MQRIFYGLIFALLVPGWQAGTKAQDVLPAGTLFQCTLEEPNFSSATANVGDPIVCQLSSIEEFGHVVVPRGSYLAGHLEAYKEPGHFVGRGCLKLEFEDFLRPNWGGIGNPTQVDTPRTIQLAIRFRW